MSIFDIFKNRDEEISPPDATGPTTGPTTAPMSAQESAPAMPTGAITAQANAQKHEQDQAQDQNPVSGEGRRYEFDPRQFFDGSPIGIVLVSKDGVIEDANPMVLSMVGREIAQVHHQKIFDLFDAQDWPLIENVLDQLAGGKIKFDPIEVRLNTGEPQNLRPVRVFTNVINPPSEVMKSDQKAEASEVRAALYILDLSQQKNLESQFIQSQKMQAVGQLAGGIAHDFNNLLTAIIGFCDLLLLRHKPGDPSFGDIQQIKQNSNRAANLVRQLLAFSRQQTLRPQVQDVTDILTEVSHLLRRLIGSNIELVINHGASLGLVKVDSGQMEQVLVNMAVNARDAMADGGMLTIATQSFCNIDPITIGQDMMHPGTWVKITVRDSGTGIPPDVMARIFEPFFTTKEVGKGTGLGLATVYGIIRQSGGYLDVTSRVGQGTEFSIYLPTAREEDVKTNDPPPVSEDAPTDLTGTARILLVEDEDAVRNFSTRALKNKGYEVVTAEDGESGWDVFQNLDQPIDLLITDVMMPGKDGPTLAREIREKVPTLKIIFISGYTEERLKDTMGENIFFLPKPFTLKDLAAKVKEVLHV
ncbi:MAG: response regulator [Alphaproteobacteria bacterium]|nr:response regulator [Alphaproteobacteria bacterium]